MDTTNATTELYELVRTAVWRLGKPGIEGWGISNPLPERLMMVQIGSDMGCDSCTCQHWSHDPSAPVRRLIVKDLNDRIVFLGRDDDEVYYALVHDALPLVILLFQEEPNMWDHVKVVEHATVPDYLLEQAFMA